MAIQDHNEVSRYNGLPLETAVSLSSGLRSASRVQLNDQMSTGKVRAPKIRKPYTITKQRERWTDEEHQKFLEALKAHGRTWRKIEEHIGTKTAVQIRSHAQKYFSKVLRESTGICISSEESIEIPPPRPKRRPSRPYPRKLVEFPSDKAISNSGQAMRSNSLKSSESDQENQSPKSVLSSAVGLDALDSYNKLNGTLFEEDGSAPNADSSLDLQTPLISELSPKESVSTKEEPDARIVKLFGANLLATDNCPTKKTTSDIAETLIGFAPWRRHSKNKEVEDNKVEKEVSWCGSNITSSINDGDNDENPDVVEDRSSLMHCYRKGEKKLSLFGYYMMTPTEPSSISELLGRPKGFMPYKRFIAERENQPFQ